jgi:hypothetical protein
MSLLAMAKSTAVKNCLLSFISDWMVGKLGAPANANIVVLKAEAEVTIQLTENITVNNLYHTVIAVITFPSVPKKNICFLTNRGNIIKQM